jgi:peptidoglycan/xylan/chitin deacetylase (PgdA/CDA1 family)
MRMWAVVAIAVAVLGLNLGATAPSAAVTTSPTVVSLTFDDGYDNQAAVAPMLDAHGMKGTFYINAGNIGQPGYLTWGQLASIGADGQEVAGHTLNHVDLATVSASDATYQVCENRARLMKHGFADTDFAYPYGSGWHDSTIRSIVQGCGYNSARGAWGLIGPDCTTCTANAETIPPKDKWAIRTADEVKSTTPLSTIEGYVTNAETHGGGWVVLILHRICEGCDQYSISQATLQGLLDWLQPRAATGTTVKTVNQVIGGTLKASPGTADTVAPTSSVLCNGSACASGSYAAPVTVTMSGSDSGGSGLDAVRYTTDGSTPTLSSNVYSGPFTVSATTTVKYRAWDNAGNAEAANSQLIQVSLDTTPPTSSISCNGSACSTGWYGGSVTVALSATDDASGVAAIRYTTDGTDPTSASTLYGGPFTVSATTTVKYRAWDNAGNAEPTNSQLVSIDTIPPASTIACNGSACASGSYAAPVTVTMSGSDSGGSGLEAIRYTTDGSTPTLSSNVYSGPFTVSATTTVKYRAWDNAGNAETTNSQLIQVSASDTTPPTSSINCNGAACSTGWYSSTVSVTLSATDDASGVAAIRYTTDGTDPTSSSTLYSGPFTVSGTSTVKYRAWDNAGNAETTKSQLIRIDTTAPTVAITSPANGASVTGTVQVQVAASDASSGIARVEFYLDGKLSSTSTTSPYKWAWNTKKTTKGSHTLTAVAVDAAGNKTVSATVTVTVH